MEYCELCNIRKVNHSNVLHRQFTKNYRMAKVTKHICDKCFNEIKSKETKEARQYNEAEKILDGEA